MSTEAQRAAWRKAKQKARGPKKPRGKGLLGSAEAVIYLRHARTAITHQVVSGAGKIDDPVYLFAMLALRALQTNKSSTKENE
jgi:hypothetical protein